MAQCQDFNAAARGLAQKISAVLKPQEPFSFSWRNASSMSVSEAAAGRAALEREMAATGLRTKEPSPGGVEVSVTIAENLRGYLWVAEIRRGESKDVVMEQSARQSSTGLAPSISIEKKLLLDEEQPVLDVAQAGSALLVLDAESVSRYELSDGVWQRKQAVQLPMTHTWPRDLRGRILAHGGSYEAYLPGVRCQGSAGSALSMACADEAGWPVVSAGHTLAVAQFTSTRNFFDGRMTAANRAQYNLPAFYSAALWEDRGTALWLLAAADGRTHLVNAAFEPVSAWAGWGSDIAGVESECGGGAQLLATKPGDSTAADSIQAYELKDSSPQAVGDAVTFPGPVTALWPAAERGAAFAISQDLKNGRYAAFRLSIRCGR